MVTGCENLREAGYNVTLIEASNQIMRPFDYDMVQILLLFPAYLSLIIAPAITDMSHVQFSIIQFQEYFFFFPIWRGKKSPSIKSKMQSQEV